MYKGQNREKAIGIFHLSNGVEMCKFTLRVFAFALYCMTIAFILNSPTVAQIEEEEYPKDVVPPPLNFISKEEKKQLNAETKMKNRTRLALELMDARLTRSEEFLEKNEYQSSLNEIGKFRGLLRNTLDYLKGFRGRKSSLKNYKKLEMNLRDFMPRLEVIRREMPYKYGFHIKRTMFFVRESRSTALNPFFNDTVLPEGSNL